MRYHPPHPALRRKSKRPLTETGLELAKKIYERHTILTDVLLRLGVDEETASMDACKMEHVISDKTFAAIKNHTKNC